ncbi:MAG TPA: molybdate ABC transporter substrate-binding protein [Cyclobacteriaceae bacterium]
MKYILPLFFLMILSTCTQKANDKPASSVTIFAAASLADVISEISNQWEGKSKAEVKINLASSGTLARQIEQGAPVDVYISANKKWAYYLDSLGYFIKGNNKAVAQNELVLISQKNSHIDDVIINKDLDLINLLNDGRLSIGDPAHVPAGQYARQALNYYGWYQLISNQVLPSRDVRAALSMVELGEAPLGIVYKTDAIRSQKVKIIGTFPAASHDPIIYIIALCSHKSLASNYYTYLTASEATKVWRKHGFKPYMKIP